MLRKQRMWRIRIPVCGNPASLGRWQALALSCGYYTPRRIYGEEVRVADSFPIQFWVSVSAGGPWERQSPDWRWFEAQNANREIGVPRARLRSRRLTC